MQNFSEIVSHREAMGHNLSIRSNPASNFRTKQPGHKVMVASLLNDMVILRDHMFTGNVTLYTRLLHQVVCSRCCSSVRSEPLEYLRLSLATRTKKGDPE